MIYWIGLGWLVVFLTLVGAITLRSRPTWLRLALSLTSLCVLTGALLPTIGSTLEPRFGPASGPFVEFSEKALLAAWWLLIARAVISAGQIVLGINHHRHSARLASDLAAGAIYLGALLAVTDLVLGVSITGLVATSGIIAIVLGLALQNTLGDLFSGLAIGIDRPFNVGDLISIEGSAEGRVIETNWRSTRIATAANDVATVPNSVVAKARITNRSVPSEAFRATVRIVMDPAVYPKRALSLLRGSALNAALLPPDANVVAICTELRGEGTVYEVQFSVPVRSLGEARSDLLHQIARHARYNGIALAPQDGTALVAHTQPDLPRLIDDVPILRALKGPDRDALASQIIRHEGTANQAIFTQAGTLASMFLIARGAFEVSRDDGNGARRLGTIGPGHYFGEFSLLTGNANAATVTALTPFVAYEVTKDMMLPLLTRNPDACHALELAASDAQALLERTIAAQVSPAPVASVRLLDRIRTFFEMGEPTGSSDTSA